MPIRHSERVHRAAGDAWLTARGEPAACRLPTGLPPHQRQGAGLNPSRPQPPCIAEVHFRIDSAEESGREGQEARKRCRSIATCACSQIAGDLSSSSTFLPDRRVTRFLPGGAGTGITCRGATTCCLSGRPRAGTAKSAAVYIAEDTVLTGVETGSLHECVRSPVPHVGGAFPRLACNWLRGITGALVLARTVLRQATDSVNSGFILHGASSTAFSAP